MEEESHVLIPNWDPYNTTLSSKLRGLSLWTASLILTYFFNSQFKKKKLAGVSSLCVGWWRGVQLLAGPSAAIIGRCQAPGADIRGCRVSAGWDEMLLQRSERERAGSWCLSAASRAERGAVRGAEHTRGRGGDTDTISNYMNYILWEYYAGKSIIQGKVKSLRIALLIHEAHYHGCCEGLIWESIWLLPSETQRVLLILLCQLKQVRWDNGFKCLLTRG